MGKVYSADHKGKPLSFNDKVEIFTAKVQRALEINKLDDDRVHQLSCIMGQKGHVKTLLLSDMPARKLCAEQLPGIIGNVLNGSENPRRAFLFSTVDDIGITSDRVPRIALKAMQNKTYRALKSEGLNAVVVMEIHPLANHPGKGKGRSLLLHSHGIAWKDGHYDRKAAAKALNSSGAWSCALGADPVDIRPVGDTPEDLERVAAYLFKPPFCAKNLMPNKKKPGKFLLMDTIKGYRSDLALRTLEVISQIPFMDAVFGVGEGTKVRQELRKRLTTWHHARGAADDCFSDDIDLWAWWCALRRDHGSQEFLPVRFDSGGVDMRVMTKRKRSPAAFARELTAKQNQAKRERANRMQKLLASKKKHRTLRP